MQNYDGDFLLLLRSCLLLHFVERLRQADLDFGKLRSHLHLLRFCLYVSELVNNFLQSIQSWLVFLKNNKNLSLNLLGCLDVRIHDPVITFNALTKFPLSFVCFHFLLHPVFESPV